MCVDRSGDSSKRIGRIFLKIGAEKFVVAPKTPESERPARTSDERRGEGESGTKNIAV